MSGDTTAGVFLGRDEGVVVDNPIGAEVGMTVLGPPLAESDPL
jgi:hypothetical protein